MANEVKFTMHTAEVLKSIEDAASKRMLEAVNLVRNTTLETLSGPRTGEQYRVPGTQRVYTASRFGEAPATATASLRQSVETAIESEGYTIIGQVGTKQVHGKHLEKGTSRMLKRPWLRPSFQKAAAEVEKIFGGLWFK